ncbi:DUF2017 family protein [Microbacterium azadirachtae]|uniref:DUF2017 family protein n=1 Tax=Microbacterium azadirachtae TaxID=582680 RepID=UPI0008886170|nr:DUF2017 family protein [Microbacterium azadirachtae]SDL32439.1 protein of unknown function [Microbacterium azadirachtae]SEF62574.1 protein of unknown function [Microbacterium azadirachtae]SEF63385.1 protein of unknown function [Microbacterium azadirachtae]
MAGSGIRVPMQAIEAQQLAELVDQFLELLRDTEIGQDSALDRLTPSVYPQDPEASAEFAEATSADLLDRRAADARVVRDGLAAASDDHAPMPEEVVIRDADVDAWLRTLAALRLVIASRLGIENQLAPDPEDPRLGVYEWLGYRLDVLVEAADALDDASDG